MKHTQQKGFVGFGIIILVALVIVGAGVYVYYENKTSVVIDEETINGAVAERYADNSAAINKVIKARAQASFSSFVVEASMKQYADGSYENVCADARSIIEADLQKNSTASDPMGITLKSYNLEQIVCKANVDKFIITMPITLEDGNAAKVCSSVESFGFVGDANYETYTCIKR